MHSHNHLLSSFSFPNIFLWSDFFDFQFETIEGYLCVFARNEIGCFLYLPPLKKGVSAKEIKEDGAEARNFRAAVLESFRVMGKTNKTSRISRVENVEPDYQDFFPQGEFIWTKKADEYCYAREDIAGLNGNPYKSKRAAYNQFVKNYHHDFRVFEREMSADCLALYESWAKNRLGKSKDDVYNHMLLENRQVHELAMRYADELGLIGRVVKVDGKIRAYSFGYPLNEMMFCVLFEITDLAMNGLSVFIFREFCRDPQVQRYQLVNVMDDFGMENIARVKKSFRPTLLLPSYVVTKKGI